MKILVLTSRYTATRDIIGENFGRQTRLFSALKKLGYDIDFFVADYRKYERKNTKLNGINVMIRPFSLFSLFSFVTRLRKVIKKGDYDYLISTSDPLWGILGYCAKTKDVKFLYDLHDNYETYDIYKIPFFKFIDNYVIRRADVVTTVSNSLKRKIKDVRSNAEVITNGFDEKLFKPKNKLSARKSLNLPKDAKIISYAGSIQRVQGIDILVDAFKKLREKFPNTYLAIAGNFYKDEEKYIDLDQENIIYLKSITQKKVVDLINASDVAVVPNTENAFASYCFPYKVVEYMACNVSIVATKVGDVKDLLAKFSELCKPSNVSDMADKLELQLKSKKKVNYRKVAMQYTWDNVAKRLDKILKKK